jgi:hypothetical protein
MKTEDVRYDSLAGIQVPTAHLWKIRHKPHQLTLHQSRNKKTNSLSLVRELVGDVSANLAD